MTANHSRDVLDDIADLRNRVRDLESSRALGAQAALCTSTTHPANPAAGRRILETDTGLESFWSGTAWVYPPQRLGQKLLTATTPSITFPVPPGPGFSTLRVAWSARGDLSATATYMCVQLNGDSGSHYLWQINQANNASTAGSGNSGATTTLVQVGTMAGATAVSGYVGSGEFVIPNASGTTFKEITGCSSSMNAVNNGFAGAYGGLWLASTPITYVTLFPASGNLIAGSAAYLYGET